MDAWQITETVAFILKHKATKIALQFPDHLLKQSSLISELLKTKLCETHKNSDYKIYIMADTTFAACCVDEISAQHVNADVIIHYGWTCCSPTNRVPVYHILGKQSFDIQLLHRLFFEPVIFDQIFCTFSKILILYEPHYHHYYDKFIQLFKHSKIKFLISQIRNESSLRSKNKIIQNDDDQKFVENEENNFGYSHFCGFHFEDMINKNEWNKLLKSDSFCIDEIKSKFCVLYIGDDKFDEYAENTSSKNQLFLSLLTNFGSCFRFVSYNPKRIESHFQNDGKNDKDAMEQILDKLGVDQIFNLKQNDALLHKFQMFRYSLIEKIKRSDIIGIVCATLVVDNYLEIIKCLKDKIRKNGKKAYMFSVGKINQAKLGNFSEIDIFVVITCPMSFHYLLPVHQQSFFKNLVTPFDCMLALDDGQNEFKWTGMYSTDFGDILTHSFKMGGIKKVDAEKDDNAEYVNGYDKTVAMFGKAGALIKRDAADYMLEKRTWKGVEFVSDDVAPSRIEQGLVGIASKYECDKELKQ